MTTGPGPEPQSQPVSLALFQIERGLLKLIEEREALLQTMSEDESTLDPQLGEEACKNYLDGIKRFDELIHAYVAAEIRKVDGVASWIRECETRAEIANQEAARIIEEGKRWTARGEQIREMVLGVMQEIVETKLEGRRHSLHRVKNPPAVDVRQPELVPLPYKKVTITLAGEVAEDLLTVLSQDNVNDNSHVIARLQDGIRKSVPSLSEIKADIRAGVPGCQLIQRERLDVDPAPRGKRKANSPGEIGVDKSGGEE